MKYEFKIISYKTVETEQAIEIEFPYYTRSGTYKDIYGYEAVWVDENKGNLQYILWTHIRKIHSMKFQFTEREWESKNSIKNEFLKLMIFRKKNSMKSLTKL